MVLTTPRLLLLPLTREMIVRRLETDDFVLHHTEAAQDVHFGPEWPGAPLGAFAFFLTQTNKQGILEGSFAAIERTTGEAVGMLGSKGPPNAAGAQEIGYGFNPVAQGQGYATEATRALVAHLLGQSGVQEITAQTAIGNRASERVLEKVGFIRTGRSQSKQHGELTVWHYQEP